MTRRIAIGAVAFAFSALLTVVLLEAALHAYFYFSNGYWLFLGRETFQVPYAKAVQDRRQYSLRENSRDGRQSVNSNGFRGAVIPSTEDGPLICVLGDSVPFGAGVGDEETFPFQLQTILRERGYPHRVLNAGVPSYNLRQSIDRWDIDVRPKYRCDAIVLNAANDVSLIDYYKSRWSPDVTWASARFGIDRGNRSSILFFVTAVMRSSSGSTATWLPTSITTLQGDFQRQLARLSSTRIPVVLMPVNPCYYSTIALTDAKNATSCKGVSTYVEIATGWKSIIEQVNSMLREASFPPAVTYLDTSALLEQRVGKEGMYVDFIHFSLRGNFEIAEAIANHLERTSLIKK